MKKKKSLERNLEKFSDLPKDNVVTFEQMGIDKLIVAEAHEFKNLFTPTKKRNLSGVPSVIEDRVNALQKIWILKSKKLLA